MRIFELLENIIVEECSEAITDFTALSHELNEAIRATIYPGPDEIGATIHALPRTPEPVRQLPISKITRLEPIEKFDNPDHAKNLKKIMLAIKQGKQLPPILVRRTPRGYQVVDGHHRFRAHELLNKKTISAQVVSPRNIDIAESVRDHIDNVHGWGAVPNNRNIDYLGMRVHMSPSQFLKLAAPLSPEESESSHDILDHLKSGGKVGSPFLTIRIPESWEDNDLTKPAKVVSHEGRNRMMALQRMQGDSPVETHLFFSSGIRARDIQPEWVSQMNSQLIPQRSNNVIQGPFFNHGA
jgi:hypothetical protein